jgi:hypothetical protein
VAAAAAVSAGQQQQQYAVARTPSSTSSSSNARLPAASFSMREELLYLEAHAAVSTDRASSFELYCGVVTAYAVCLKIVAWFMHCLAYSSIIDCEIES